QWLGRDCAPAAVKEFDDACAKAREAGASIEPGVHKFQTAAAQAIVTIATPAQGDDKHRALARIGAANVVEDLLCIGSVLGAREALDSISGKLPGNLRVFGESH